jgi:tetratricopeptide (TPR) repeat protein
LHAEQGRFEAAASELDRVALHDFTDLPRDYLRIPCLAYLADVCFALRDSRRAALLYDLLMPYANRCVVLGYGIACLGALGRQLGVLAATMQRFDLAASHFEQALQSNRRLHARPALARTQLSYAQGLHRDPQGDKMRALQLAREAGAIAAELGMSRVEGHAAKLCSQLEAALPTGEGKPAPAARLKPDSKPETAVFQRRGDVWTATFEGKDVQLKDLLGFNYMAHLLRYPEREFHVLDLVSLASAGREDEGPAPTAALYGDAGEQLDPRARAEYRERLRELK